MTAQELKNNGIALAAILAMMQRAEKLISYFNEKYDFNMCDACEKDRGDYNSALSRWDVYKAHSEILLEVSKQPKGV